MKKQKRAFNLIVFFIVMIVVIISLIVILFSSMFFDKKNNKQNNSDDFLIKIYKLTNPVIGKNGFQNRDRQAKFIRAIAFFNGPLSVSYAINGVNPNNLKGSDIVDIIVKHSARGIVTYRENNFFQIMEGTEYKVETDGGDCSNGACYVIIDINGFEKEPNKIWKGEKIVYDRLKLRIERVKDQLFIYEPKFIKHY